MDAVSLCSGVGLLDLGLEWAGMRTTQLCEIDPWCRGILQQRFPGADVHDDAWTINPMPCDVLAAGFPCQPFSVAGRGLGDQDPRHLWPAISRAIRLARPRYVILENVPGLVAWGLGEVLGDLAEAGFDAEWTCFRASDVGALHRRNRWWLAAVSDADVSGLWDADGGFFREGWASQAVAFHYGPSRPVANADALGRGVRSGAQEEPAELAEPENSGDLADADEVRAAEPVGIPDGWRGRAAHRCDAGEATRGRAAAWIPQPPMGGTPHGSTPRVDGPNRDVPLPGRWLDGTWEDGTPRVRPREKNTNRRLSALGNGVVPQCAELVGLRIRQFEEATA